MSEPEEDLELQALQRQLDDAFQTTRPRPSFEDELWLRMQSRRPIWLRIRDGLAGLIEGMREAPAVPSAAVAVVLIVLLGIGIVRTSGLHFGAGGGSTAAGTAQDGNRPFGPNAAPAFGPLQAPALATTPPSVPPVEGLTQSVAASPNRIYLGPASLTWAGHLNVTATNLPVFRYQEPTSAAANQFAASVGASPSPQVAPGGLGMYTGENFTLVVTGSAAQPPHEPSFSLSELKSAPGASGGDPVAIATAYLAAHSLIPTWPYQTDVQTTGGTVRVRFLRSFDVVAVGQIALVGGVGDPYGIEVDTATGTQGAFENGPLPLSLESANYPIINADQAVQSALASTLTSSGATSYPAVRLTKAELVYKLVWAGDHSFYEPAFLFSGTFTDHGIVYVKRVLVPAINPSFLSH
jgi:hypothetical protein